MLPKEPQLYRSNNLSKGVGELLGMMTIYAVYLFYPFHHGYNTKIRIG